MLKSVLVVAILVGLFGWLQFAATASDEASPGEQKLLRHVVMFGFKESSSEADVQVVVDAFRKLPEQIPEIAAFEYGTNNSPEGLNDGLTHCFFVSFKSEADRAAYLPHPAHKAFVEVLKPHLEKVVVIDYWAAQ
ncbi:MAG: Dabb family protein [Planctomycetota bacterium]